MNFRILSYNVHKGIGGIDRRYKPERITQTIEYYNPDIVLLQEVSDGLKRSQHHRQVDMFADQLGFEHRLYQANVRRKIGDHGNAILSRYPMNNAVSMNLTVPPKKKRNGLGTEITFRFDGQSRTVVLVNVHLGLAGYERAIQIAQLSQNPYVQNRSAKTPVLIGGDFNDVWENLCRKVLNAEGFTSALSKAKTFPAIYPTRALDRIFYRGDIKVDKAFVGHTAIAREASDHLPVITDFELV